MDLDFGQRYFNFSHSQVAQFQLLLGPVIHDDELIICNILLHVYAFFLIRKVFCIVVLRLILVFHKMSAPPFAILQMDLQIGGKVTVAKYSTQVYDAKD